MWVANIKEATGLYYWRQDGQILVLQPGYLLVRANREMQQHVDQLLEDIRKFVPALEKLAEQQDKQIAERAKASLRQVQGRSGASVKWT